MLADDIVAIAERDGDRVAIEEDHGNAVSYRELVARARRFAERTRGAGVVEVVAARSADFVARCLGAWLVGRAWAPLDAAEPSSRRERFRARLAEADAHERAGELAYVIATSGSSGVPKAVMVSHRGIPALIRAQIDAFELAPGARSLWLHAPVFDASLSDWGTALASGATLVVPSPRALSSPATLLGELVGRGITHVDLPPVLLDHVAAAADLGALRVVVLGGEACPVDTVRELARRVRVVVVYGPTEATVCSSLVVVDPERWTAPLIGEPLPGTQFRVTGGQLWIGGVGVAIGYAGDDAETLRCFTVIDGERGYLTGDRVHATAGGPLAFAGRVDRQRKIAGRRVELGEVEGALRRAAKVRDAAASVRVIAGRERIVGFVEGEPGELDAGATRAALAHDLPDWLVPARIVVGRLPRTQTGKIDIAGLEASPLPALDPAEAARLTRARGGTAVMAELAVVWCEVLAADTTAGTFAEAGGDSLARLGFHAAAAARGIALPHDALDGDPTLATIAARAAAGSSDRRVADCEAAGLAEVAARGPAIVVRDHGDAILVTGATGALGAHLVRALRRHAPARRVIAVVRGDVEIDGVDVVRGDVTVPMLGVGETIWRGVGTIVHAAATTSLADGWDAHAAVNVGGTAEVARIARARELALHHVSTLAVFASTDRARGHHTAGHLPDPDAIALGGYAQTKVAAEAIVRACRERDAATTLFRLGLLVGPRPAARRDQLAMTIRGLAKLGAAPAAPAELRFDATRIDYAADAIAALAIAAESAEPAKRDATYHVSARAIAFAEIVAAMQLPVIAADAWAARARDRLADVDVAMAFVSLARAHSPAAPLTARDLFLATSAEFAPDLRVPDADVAMIVAGALGADAS